MAIASFKRVDIVAHKSVTEDLVAELQQMGFCEQIKEVNDQSIETTKKDLQENDFENVQAEIKFLLRFLEPKYKDDGGIGKMLSPKPKYKLNELQCLFNNNMIPALSEEIRKMEKESSNLRSKETFLKTTRDVLVNFSGMSFPLAFFSQGTAKVHGILGSVATSQFVGLKDFVASLDSDLVDFYSSESKKNDKETYLAIVYSKEIEREILDACAQFGLSRIDLDESLVDFPEKEKKMIARSLEIIEKQNIQAEDRAVSLADKWVPKLRLLSDYLSVLADRFEVVKGAGSTEKIVFLSFWIPEKSILSFKNKIKRFENLIDYRISDPDKTDKPPVLLDNSGFFGAYEPLTSLYGAPAYGSIDPTSLMAPFFFVFFGMCLGDGGYGLLLAFVFFGAIKKYHMVGDSRRFFSILGLGGISTIFMGMVTGSWLGDMIDVFPFLAFLAPIKNAPAFLDPLNDPITFLIISLALGVIQILYGLSVALIHNFKKGDKVAAFADQGGWIALLVGILLYAGGLSGFLGGTLASLGKVLGWGGVVILVATQGRHKPTIVGKIVSGVLSLYNLTSYLGDVLSYSRLLALGLASSAVAMIINMLSDLVGGVPYVGWIFGALIFVGGHLFNLAINVLGAFVHSLRLQYVEFFSKFYVSGGRTFDPLRYRTDHVTICEGAE
ncbi:V-type ATP synthase subunit I [Aminithiophilus ramosus]|uniref:V-type ATP synthase subunit I n=1 Tax=Aminithiophilus ramosus TaxID=3029084 RepID=A0A9Q7EXB6_9BACT|nr:V-type ATP synthase subunit I [Aminithiophilus ramosus]QTX33519.1 V-type ATP synthase subunit I [Aminithiophilus ramosus]